MKLIAVIFHDDALAVATPVILILFQKSHDPARRECQLAREVFKLSEDDDSIAAFNTI
ncbi:hypothetical protein [Paraburkholderia flagellata]|uniref:hypothetical protein n=1 Tax=Paraburkholderia flagellata TaxID=2883241 RepID=UPI001F271E2B|nr:hypothetical protein [Paraburkholderia flagellata]